MDTKRNDQKDQRDHDRSGEVIAPGIFRNDALKAPLLALENDTTALEVDPDVFSLEAVLRAAYKFTDRSYLFVKTHDNQPNRWCVVIRPKQSGVSSERLASELANELIDQRLRTILEQQFGDVRTLIVAQAFSEGNLFDQRREDDDSNADPRAIGRLRP